MGMMKRSIVVLAAAFATMSTSALAESGAVKAAKQTESAMVKLSDAELDGITGAGALSQLLIFNPGRGPGEEKQNNAHSTCINCFQYEAPAGTSGVMTVMTPNGKVITVTIRQAP